MISKINEFIQKLIHGRKELSPSSKAVFDKFANEEIRSIEVNRQPLSSLKMIVLRALTSGKIQENMKEKGYDYLFHLRMNIVTVSGGRYSLEKNQQIAIKGNPVNTKESDSMNVPLSSKKLTLAILLENARKHVGADDLFVYSAKHRNCQRFCLDILRSSQLSTPKIEAFVKQDMDSIFKDMEWVRRYMNIITDLAARADIIYEGGGSESQIQKTNALSSYDIEDYMFKNKSFAGVYSKDRLPITIKRGKWYIVNMQNYDEGDGTHWVTFKSSSPMLYFDSMGFPPPNEIMEKASPSGILFNQRQIQDYDSTACGYYCIACVDEDPKDMTGYKRFLNKFSDNTDANDYILKDLLKW